MMRYGDKGEAVRTLQKALLARGYELPVFGADGALGDETWEALRRFSEDRHAAWSPEVPPAALETLRTIEAQVVPPRSRGVVRRAPSRETVCEAVCLEAAAQGMSERDARAVAEDVADRLRLEGEVGDEVPKSGFFDLRHEQDFTYPRGKRKTRKHRGKPVLRDPSKITTIVVHQTAAEFGVSKRSVALAGGNVELARARRALDVACHAMAFRAGYFVAAHPLRVYVNHGNRFNSHSLGLEIDGRYPGLLDDPTTVAREDLNTTWGGTPTELTEATVDASRAALRWLVEEGRREGMPLEFIVSHRQSSDTRRSDPGEAIWQRIVLEYAVPELGLTAVRESRWKEGRPIPAAWDPEGIGAY